MGTGQKAKSCFAFFVDQCFAFFMKQVLFQGNAGSDSLKVPVGEGGGGVEYTEQRSTQQKAGGTK